MINFFVYYVLVNKSFKKIPRKQLQNKNYDWCQFNPTSTKRTFIAGRQRVKLHKI